MVEALANGTKAALEKENDEMEGKLERDLQDWKKLLEHIDAGRPVGAI
jgi:hypothetical protein